MRRVACLVAVALFTAALLSACPPQGAGGGGGGGGGGRSAGIQPDSCGKPTAAEQAWTRLYAFLVASRELDRASTELESSVAGACRRMATELGINPTGDTRAVCDAVSAELKANLSVSVSQEKHLVTREVPGECHTEMDLGARVAADCEAQSTTQISLRCEGRCTGTCNGACNGTCAGSTGAGGQCNGSCDGTCGGTCTGGCDGYASGGTSAECRAAVEVQSSVHTVCTPPHEEVVQESVTVVDATRFAKAQAAIEAGLPTIRESAMRAQLVARATVDWAKTLGELAASTGDLVQELGERAVCVGAQLHAALAAVTQVQARFSVSIEVSASISGSAGVQ
ncbi:MAG TPA: hypothetical protein VHE35_32115 [Kofleriaceae bacterium]|nr:hypothetical protein [Kofleriaceae bacterium]